MSVKTAKISFQDLLQKLTSYWASKGCVLHQGHDVEVGAGTSNPATFLRSLGPEPYNAVYIEPSRRPRDGRYGQNPNRMQCFHQGQVILKPSPPNCQDLYLESLAAMGLDLSKHDIRFVHDDWENPSLGASGLGWEVWCDGMEISQFTYFQTVGGIPVDAVTCEITYGLERLAMYLNDVNNVYDLPWNDTLSYGDVRHEDEVEWSAYNFEQSSAEMWARHFADYESEAKRVLEAKLPIPAYDFVIKASHAFNMLDARGAVSVSERASYIGRIRNLAKLAAEGYIEERRVKGFPLLRKEAAVAAPVLMLPSVIPSTGAAPFLLEVGCEELPASFVEPALAQLGANLQSLLQKQGIAFSGLSTLATPRRLAVTLEKLDCGKPASHIEKKGPSVAALYDATGAVSKAGAGFFKSIGLEPCKKEELASVASLQMRDGYVFATITQPAVSTYSILQKALPELILGLDFPKSMRWARETLTWARPLQWFVALLGSTPISFSVGTVLSGIQSRGHRILGKSFTVTSPERYVADLRKQHVAVSIEERRASIEEQLAAIEAKTGLKVVSKERVIHQVTELVEWPLLCVGQFSASFLKIPQEILISEMIEHQKYFPLAHSDGKLANQFVITANNTPSEMIVRGNEKVLSARLQDGVFLYEQDSKTDLKGFAERLSTITYMQGLGSMAAKSKRLQDLCTLLYGSVKLGSLEDHRLVASLAKADLTTELVAEFPELQGIIGRHYALNMGLSQDVADSIDQHWNPRNEASELPQTASSIIVALADKIDNILACFSMGLIPTSSKDPYALRRQVLATARILIAHKQHLSLRKIFEQGYDLLAASNKLPRQKAEVLTDITAFFANRIRTIFEAHNFAHDEIEATLAAGFDDIYDSYLRIEALHEFRSKSTHFTGLLEVFKRTKGQLAAHPAATTDVNHALLFEEAEVNLFSSLRHQMPHFDRALAERNYEDAYKRLALLQEPLSELFAKVMIQCDDVRIKKNRLALLKNVQDRCLQLLDFSHIQVL